MQILPDAAQRQQPAHCDEVGGVCHGQRFEVDPP